MDDDKGLELSLGLACGGSSSNSKDKSSNSIDGKTEPTDTDERTNKVINEFKNFLSAGAMPSFQRNDSGKQENFFCNLQRRDIDRIASDEEPGVGENKHKCIFDEMNNYKKQETNSRDSDLQAKDKMSHISITTDEGSTADNEDVAESEPEGSTSRFSSQCEYGSRTPGGSGSSSQALKELSRKENGSAFSVQSMNTVNVPYAITMKESPSASALSTSSHPLSGMMQGSTSANGVHPRPHTSAVLSLPMSFGFSPSQLPVLDDKDNTWRVGAHPQGLPSPYAGRPISASGLDVHSSEHSKDHTQLLAEEGGDDAKRQGNSFPLEFPVISPGIAAEVKFGGSGSFPNLPWVSTTSPGPNGRTISGVTYKYNATQIKILCACHGVHMSPEEFVRHATEAEHSSMTTPNVSSLQSTNPTTSAMT